MTEPRHYRLSPRDRTGWVFGLSGVQCIALGIGTLFAGLLLDSPAAPLIGLPILASLLFAFGRWNGLRLCESIPILARWWVVRLLGLNAWASATSPLPTFMDGLEIEDVSTPAWLSRIDQDGVGVVFDHFNHTLSGSLRISTRRFSLCEPNDQDDLLSAWSGALSAFANERQVVRRVIWSEHVEITSPQIESQNTSPTTSALDSYRDLVSNLDQRSTVHSSYLSVVVDLRKVHSREDGNNVLLEELRLLSGRLENAGFDVDVPLSKRELLSLVHSRLSTTVDNPLTRSLVQLAGIECPDFSTAASSDWNWIDTGEKFHHTYLVGEWPRLDVRADWMEPLVFDSSASRTITITAEPVAPSHSRRQVERDATKLATDESQRERAGFRIGADHRRNATAVVEREEELTSGYVEFTYSGVVTISSNDVSSLRTHCLDYEQLAASCGVGLVSLDGRHDLGLICSLPLGRGPAPVRLS